MADLQRVSLKRRSGGSVGQGARGTAGGPEQWQGVWEGDLGRQSRRTRWKSALGEGGGGQEGAHGRQLMQGSGLRSSRLSRV